MRLPISSPLAFASGSSCTRIPRLLARRSMLLCGRRVISQRATQSALAVMSAPVSIVSASHTRTTFFDIGANLLDGMFQGEYHGKRLHAPDLDAVLQRAADAGVAHAIVTAGDLADARAALALARTHNARALVETSAGRPSIRLHTTVGVHPTNTSQLEGVQLSGASAHFPRAAVHGEGSADTAAERTGAGDVRGGAGGAPALDKEAYVAALRGVIEDGLADGTVVAIGECGLDYDRLHFAPQATQLAHFELHFALAEEFGLPMFLHDRNTSDDFYGACGAGPF
jgi:TatD DNase family protein